MRDCSSTCTSSTRCVFSGVLQAPGHCNARPLQTSHNETPHDPCGTVGRNWGDANGAPGWRQLRRPSPPGGLARAHQHFGTLAPTCSSLPSRDLASFQSQFTGQFRIRHHMAGSNGIADKTGGEGVHGSGTSMKCVTGQRGVLRARPRQGWPRVCQRQGVVGAAVQVALIVWLRPAGWLARLHAAGGAVARQAPCRALAC